MTAFKMIENKKQAGILLGAGIAFGAVLGLLSHNMPLGLALGIIVGFPYQYKIRRKNK